MSIGNAIVDFLSFCEIAIALSHIAYFTDLKIPAPPSKAATQNQQI